MQIAGKKFCAKYTLKNILLKIYWIFEYNYSFFVRCPDYKRKTIIIDDDQTIMAFILMYNMQI